MRDVLRYSAVVFFILVFVAAPFPWDAAFGESAPTPDWEIGFSFDGAAVSEGGRYALPLATDRDAAYQWTPSGLQSYGELYSGTLNDAVLLDSHPLDQSGRFVIPENFPAPGKYFVTVFEFDPNCDALGGDLCFLPDLRQVQAWFGRGFRDYSALVPDHWGIINFEVVEDAGPAGVSNIAFVPGLEASRLYVMEAGGENQ